jgi:hypothetical protein
MLTEDATCDGSRTLKGLDDGLGIGGVGLAEGVGVDVSVSEWSLQADPARSRNASAMLLSNFFTIECYDSMRQRNQIYLERWTSAYPDKWAQPSLDRNSVLMNTYRTSITPKAIQDLLDELEASKQSRLRAWNALQRFRSVLSEMGNVAIPAPTQKTFDAEGEILDKIVPVRTNHFTRRFGYLMKQGKNVERAAVLGRASVSA